MVSDQPAVATLAAAIVIARNATSIAAIREAWTDAGFIVCPVPHNSKYKTWQAQHDEVPSATDDD
jgi:hypothetical protein